jgi:hypothetical protein
MPTTLLTILAEYGRNEHGQRLVRVKCACGSPEFIVRFDSVKNGNTKSCGCLQKKKHKEPKLKYAPVTEQKSTPDPVSELEYGSIAWIDAHIESKKSAARSAEIRVKELQDSLAVSESTDLTLLKMWTAESAAFEKLNHQIARLQAQKDKAETGLKKDERTQAEIMKDRIKTLKAGRQ